MVTPQPETPTMMQTPTIPIDTAARARAVHVVPRCMRSRTPERRGLRIAAWLALLASVAAQARAADGPEGLLVRPQGGDWRETVALETEVDYRIRGLLAEVTVTQRFHNDSGEWLEGRYLLPLPGDAAVGALRLLVGDRIIEGEIREKAQAQAEYAAAAASGRSASLVEQNRPNLFNTAVANIGPGESVEIHIGYWQSVDFSDGAFSVALPLTLVPRYQSKGLDTLEALDVPAVVRNAEDSAIDLGMTYEPNVSISVDLDAGLPLASVTSPSHAIEVEPAGRGYRVRLANLVEASDRDFELRWTPRASAVPQQSLFVEEVEGEFYAQLMLVPPTVPVEPVPRELILVIDNSGSMYGEPMVQAIAALDRALSRLRPDDRFNVIRFDHTTEAVFEHAVPASADNVAHARRFVQRLKAEGGTELLPALELALADAATPGYLRQIVLMTDAGIDNEQQLLAYIESRRDEARLFAVGIGSAPNEHFLRRAVELGRGAQVMVRDTGEVRARTDALLARLDQPALRDLDIRWPGVAEMYPSRLPDLYVGEPLRVVAKLSSPAGRIEARGQGRHQGWRDAVDLLTATRADGRGIARLWARARITELDDQLRDGASEEDIRARILEVALRHGLVSRYTSLVAVDRTPVRPVDADLASAAFANAAPNGLAYANGSTGARLSLGLGLLLAVLALALMGRRREETPAPGRLRKDID
ncbi:marine proteobacterial sortase target protein [Pseudofulvimonas gallinarii]|nr:marine proteobacterial sortase target protein [Pseudofulvimonas gallinarii]